MEPFLAAAAAATDGNWIIALIALAAMEIVLGIDNIVFIAIVTGKLPPAQQPSARRWGLAAAMVMRILLLFTIWLILKLNEPFFRLTDLGIPASWFAEMQHPEEVIGVSVKDLILLVGGLFLIASSVHEIHTKFEGGGEQQDVEAKSTFSAALIQIAIMDIIFSLDSVITAVGMADQIWVMVVAVIIAVSVMLVFAGPVSRFVADNPTLKMLALSFLILIGVMLVAEGVGTHIDKRYIYFAMGFALFVEFLNMRVRSPRQGTKGLEPERA